MDSDGDEVLDEGGLQPKPQRVRWSALPPERRGGIRLLGPEDAPMEGDLDIARCGPCQSPFAPRSLREASVATQAYREYLKYGGDPAARAAAGGVGLRPRHGRVSLESRLRGLSRLAERVRAGEVIRLRCDCGFSACHGEVIMEWVSARLRPS